MWICNNKNGNFDKKEIMEKTIYFVNWSNFQKPEKNPNQPKWMSDLTKDDLDILNELGSLNTVQLMEKVKDLMNTAYQLGLEECMNYFVWEFVLVSF